MSMSFMRSFAKPFSVTAGPVTTRISYAPPIDNQDLSKMIEIVNVGSGPNDFKLQYRGRPNIFAKRVRLFCPYVNAPLTFTTSNTFLPPELLISSPFLDIAIFKENRDFQPGPPSLFNDKPLRIRSHSLHPFKINEWIDTNNFMKADFFPQNPQFVDQNNPMSLYSIAINATDIVVLHDGISGLDFSDSRIEMEYFCNKETARAL